MIKVISYSDFGGVSFGASREDVVSHFGKPDSEDLNREGGLELKFPDFIVRFDAVNVEMRECTLLPRCIAEFNGAIINWDERFLRNISSLDDHLMEVSGAVVSLKLGVALVGFHEIDDSGMAVHVFKAGDWDELRKYMIPINFLS